MMARIAYAILFLLLVQTAIAATIQGTVYDWDLNPVNNTIIEVNSTPQQTIVSKEGDYALSLGPGMYEIKAKTKTGEEATESVTVSSSEGTYNVDIIIFPSIDNPEDIFNESDINAEDITVEKNNNLSYIFFIGALILIAVLAIIFISHIKKKEKEIKHEVATLKKDFQNKEVDEELKKLVDAIKAAGGRTTQKDIRKQFPSSEAKISLMITELEKKEIIEKIKKGRGNIIILK